MSDETGTFEHVEMPLRPRILPGLPVLRRCAGEIQVGLDPRHAAVVSGLPEPVVAAAGQLTGHRTSDELLAAAGPDPAGQAAMRELIRALAGRRLVEDAADERAAAPLPGRLAGEATTSRLRSPGQCVGHPGARREFAVTVQGDGRLAVSIACLLAAAGVGRVYVAAGGSVQPEDTGTGYLADDVGRPRRVAAREALARVDGSVRTGRLTARRPDLVVLADALVPAPESVGVLTSAGVTHLVARVRDGVGIVGPLVVPGLTSCLRCADLHRSELDDCWPRIAAQLAGRAQLADLACTQATAAFATAQALAALSWSRSTHQRPAIWNASVEIDPFAATTHYRSWQPHARCPCGAARRSPTKG